MRHVVYPMSIGAVCLECGKKLYDLRPHLRMHRMTVQEYEAKHNVKINRHKNLIQKIYVFAESVRVYEIWLMRRGSHRDMCIYTNGYKWQGLPATTRVIVVSPHFMLSREQQEGLEYLHSKGCDIKTDLEW